jgi:hypothetical protein
VCEQPPIWPLSRRARKRRARARGRRRPHPRKPTPLWPELSAYSYVNAPGRAPARARDTCRARPKHLADALAHLDLPAAAANLRALAYPERDRIPPAWVRWGLADAHGLTSKGARVLEHIARLHAAGISPHDLMHPGGLGVLRQAWNLLALRAAPCPHPAAWRRDGIVTPDRTLTPKGHAILNALEGLARDLDVPFGSLD